MDVMLVVRENGRLFLDLKLDRSWVVHVICKTVPQPNAFDDTLLTATVTKIIISNAGINIDTHQHAMHTLQMNTALSHTDNCFC